MKNQNHNMRIKKNKRGRPQRRDILKIQRTMRGWTQEEVALLIEKNYGKKLTGSHVGAIERGRKNPSIELLQILSLLYEMPMEELLS